MQKVTKLLNIGINEHGTSILTEIQTAEGNVALLFEPAMLEALVADLSAALAQPEIRKTQSTMGVVSASEPRRSRVAPDTSGKAVLLSFQMPSGLEHHFALPTQDATRVAHQMQIAASSQKKSKGIRH